MKPKMVVEEQEKLEKTNCKIGFKHYLCINII